MGCFVAGGVNGLEQLVIIVVFVEGALAAGGCY
jgi:hypothetical protein